MLESERSAILARQTAWQAAQGRIADVRVWCERVARDFDRLSYAEKRDAPTALDVRVVLRKADLAPRWRSRPSCRSTSVRLNSQ